ncbi:MAG: sulfotransferase, partial [Pseudomonadota bacterium]
RKATVDLRYDREGLNHDRVFRMFGLTLPDALDGEALLSALLSQLRKGREGPLVITYHAATETLERLFPGAVYLHICRDPRDVAASVTRLGWAGNTYFGVDPWLEAETDWDRFKAHAAKERYCEISYEALVLDPKSELSRVCAFLGLDFAEAMLGYAKKSTYDAPDPSLVTRWPKTLSPREVALIERKCGDLLEDRGYTRAHPKRPPPGALLEMVLKADNKIRKVLAAISFFGFTDYALEKVYRLPGLKDRHLTVKRRMDETVNKSLK